MSLISKKPKLPKNNKYYKFLSKFGIRFKLTYEQRVYWFIFNYYETGMEYELLLHGMKESDLDNIEWYDEIVKIPKYIHEL